MRSNECRRSGDMLYYINVHGIDHGDSVERNQYIVEAKRRQRISTYARVNAARSCIAALGFRDALIDMIALAYRAAALGAGFVVIALVGKFGSLRGG